MAELWHAKRGKNRENRKISKTVSTSPAYSTALERKFKKRRRQIFWPWTTLLRGVQRIAPACCIWSGSFVKYGQNRPLDRRCTRGAVYPTTIGIHQQCEIYVD